MINDVSDFIDPMNLLLPENKQIPQNADLKKWSIEKYQDYFMGYVSFIRAGDTGVDTEFVGSPLDAMFQRIDGTMERSQLNVERFTMAPSQAKVYLSVVDQKKSDVRNNERQAAAFVFPDGTYGGKFPRNSKDKVRTAEYGLGKYVVSTKKDEYKATKEFKNATNSIEKIRQLSCLYAAIIEKIEKAPGLCFIYTELLFGSGAVALAMCLESMGYTRYKDDFSAFEATTTKTMGFKIAPYCASNAGERQIKIKKEKRYGLITSETNANRDSKLKELFNSEENKHGGYCKILIGSKVARDGINLANVQDVFLPSMWTSAGMYQAMQRAIRATSHISLVKESVSGRVEIRIHRMAAVAVRGKERISVDLDMFAIAERKDRQIALVRRKIRQVAGDCLLQHARNNREGPELDYTSVCDYDVCSVPCFNKEPSPGTIDYSTYHMFYSKNEITTLQSMMRYVFSFVTEFSMPEFAEQYGVDSIIVYLAVADAIQKKIIFTNRFGQEGLITVRKSRVYLIPPTLKQTSTPELDHYYTSVLISEEKTSLREFVVKRTDVGVVISETSTRTRETVKSVDVYARLLESALLKKEKDRTPEEKYTINRFKNYYYTLREPIEELRKEQETENKSGKGRGRKPSETTIHFRRKPLNPKEVELGDPIQVHTMLTIPKTDNKFNIVSRFKNPKPDLRIYDPRKPQEGWRDMNKTEKIVYNALLQGRIKNLLKPFMKLKYYGLILSDNEFRIAESVKSEDVRFEKRGRTCHESSWGVDELLLVGKTVDLSPPTDFTTKKPRGYDMSKDQVMHELQQTFELKNRKKELEGYSLDELRYIYAFVKSNFNRGAFCQLLQKQFRDKGILFEA
jgi:hypothetical protein